MKCTMSDNPLTTAVPTREKGIYGDDTRLAVSEDFLEKLALKKDQKDQMFVQQARASCILVFAPRLKKKDDHWLLKTKLYHEENNLCEDEKFYGNPALGFCSGFAFEKDNEYYVCAAGHCSRDIKASQIAFVFDFRQDKDGQFPSSVPLEKVVFPVNTPSPFAFSYTNDAQDFVVFKCATPPPYSLPYSMLDSKGIIKKGDAIVMLGHPCGIPQISDEGTVLDTPHKTYFRTNLSAYHGNSGSAVIQKSTGQLVGILVRGDQDFQLSMKGMCYKSAKCPLDAEGCRGEDVVRMDVILKYAFDKDHKEVKEEQEKTTWAPTKFKCSGC